MSEHFSPAEIAALLESAAAAIRAEVEALPKAVSTFHPAEGEWSINEVIGHLIEAERRGFAGRIKIFLASKDPQVEAWEQNEVARGRRDDMKSTAKLVTAKLAVYETMRARGWPKVKLAKELGMSENSVRRLLDLHHSSHMWIIDEALAKMNAELPIDLPKVRPSGKAA